MLADRLKTLREGKSWSQAHLADAARVNIRTVQRIEAGEPASHETLLSLAAALDVSLSELEPEGRSRARRRGPSRPKLALAGLLLAPATLFIVVNLLQSAGMERPFDIIAELGASLMSFRTFNLVSPVIFLGGAVAALAICLPSLVRLRTTKLGRGAVSVDGLEVRAERSALIIAAGAILTTGILLAYAGLEFLHTPVP
jgi:transcriptional regulator with XRE-family HTH domain